MTEVGDAVVIKRGICKGNLGIVTNKYYGNGSYLFNCYIIKDLKTNKEFEYYRKEFKQISKLRLIAELL